jgi:sn1-specific diacylglycerol lipase
MEHMRNEVLDLIGRIKVPKMQVAKTVIARGVKKGLTDTEDVDDISRENNSFLFDTGAVSPRTEFHIQLERFQEIQNRRKEARGLYRDVKLFPPGKIVHLVKTGEVTSCIHSMAKCLTCCTSNVGSEYTPVWADNADFNEILVSPTMGFDHFPNRVCLELEKVANHFGIDTSIGSTLFDKQEGDRMRNFHQQIL